MNAGNTVFSQLMSLIPDYEFRKCIDPVKCSKSRLVTTSAIKHFIAKVAYFYPKSGVVLGASIYVKPPPTAILRLAKRLRRLPEQARPFPLTRLPVAFPVAFQKGSKLVSAQYYSRSSHPRNLF